MTIIEDDRTITKEEENLNHIANRLLLLKEISVDLKIPKRINDARLEEHYIFLNTLQKISKGVRNAKQLATEALKTLEIKFQR